MYILGISAFYHDSAACLISDGNIIAAAQEERFTRKKHDLEFPANAIRYCLAEAGIAGRDLAYVAFYERPHLKFDRIVSTHLSNAPGGFSAYLTSMDIWIKKKIWIREIIQEELRY